MEIILEISKTDVMDEVGRVTAYYGTASGDGAPGYDTAAATPDDQELLNVYWSGAKDDLFRIAQRFEPADISGTIKNSRTSERYEDYTLRLEMPSSWDTEGTERLRNAMRLYAIHDITAKWAVRAIPSAAEGIAALSTADVSAISQLLHHTLRPTE